MVSGCSAGDGMLAISSRPACKSFTDSAADEPPQERRDQKPMVPALQQAPGAGDRDIGKHRSRRQTAGLPL